MRSKFGIPAETLLAIIKRDVACSYCLKRLLYPYDTSNRCDSATIEHLSFDGPFYWKDNLKTDDIVMVCGSCNSSRGSKTLEKWFQSAYCKNRNINQDSVSEPVRNYIIRYPYK